ncbi:MAG: sulfite exporter TauE/SafE family protein [Synergistaceae bacterium]|jgi:sulfite exporter TauE/SafE/copper chaperone CopZ|nr:sulfite exporter TauE/SafE family protein [Synergistaceae bacterium]
MPQNLKTKTLHVANMTCVSCESRIERKLKSVEGVADVKASFAQSNVQVTYDTDKVGMETIERHIEALEYRVVKPENSKEHAPKTDLLKVLWVMIALYELYTLFDRFGLLDVFYAFPEAKAEMGYGMLFLIGVLTSVHCVAMCGGINLSQSFAPRSPLPRALEETLGARLAALQSGALYNLGRVVSYTFLGGVVGALGSAVSFSGNARGWVQLVVGVFMVVMGLNMLNVFPWLRKLNPRLPKFFADKIHSGDRKRAPLYVGLLNGLMPCGPLQSMQLYALSTGNFTEGALSMFLFSLGTLPLMLGLSVLSSLLSKKFTHGMITVGATLVVVLGVAMFGNGMNLSGLSLPGFAPSAAQATRAQVEGDVQVVRTELASGRYEPIAVQVGIPVRWIIHAEPDTLNGCNNRIIIPEYGKMQKTLEAGDNVLEFTPTRSGSFVYTCWMGMIRGRITVLDEAGNGDFDDGILAVELPPDVLTDIAAATSEDFDIFELLDAANESDKVEENAQYSSFVMANRRSCCTTGPVTLVTRGARRVQTQRSCH